MYDKNKNNYSISSFFVFQKWKKFNSHQAIQTAWMKLNIKYSLLKGMKHIEELYVRNYMNCLF